LPLPAFSLRFLTSVSNALEAVYRSQLSRAEKLAKKQEIIAQYQEIYRKDYAPRFQSAAYRKATKLPLNNAYLMLFTLYTDHIPLLARFEQERCGSDLKTFMREMERLSKSPGKMIDKIEAALARPAPRDVDP